MARKRSRKTTRKTTRRARKPSGWRKCKYVGTRASKTMANRLARELKADGYRALVQTPHLAHEGYSVLSCGRTATKRKRAKRRSRR